MRAQDLRPAGRGGGWPSPLPVALGALVVLLGVRAAAVVGPVDVPAWWTPTLAAAAPEAAASPRTDAPGTSEPVVELSALATIAPTAGPAPAPLDPSALLAAQLDRLINPEAGPPGLGTDPLRPEPFLDERRELARQQEALAVRQLALEVAEERLRGHVERLEALKAEVEALVQLVSDADEARLQALVQLYERMRPKQAAAIFDDLDFEVLAPLALRMRDMKLAPILGAMAPGVARDLTAELARRREDTLVANARDLLR
jgi:flagellar motility protein MotE (MotC chaperone)